MIHIIQKGLAYQLSRRKSQINMINPEGETSIMKKQLKQETKTMCTFTGDFPSMILSKD